MPTFRLAQICGKGHLLYIADSLDDLASDNQCYKCGSQIFSQCPECEAPVRVRGVSSDDGSISWNRENHCYNCGVGLPWKPSQFQQMLNALGTSHSPSPSGVILPQSTRKHLEETKYGHEVISHIQEGDRCYSHSLWQPALGSYIHAFEWAAITYLEDVEDVDIIAYEREGNFYTFAKGGQNILDELQQYVDLDQKTVSSIKRMNRAERRWMAHHKSGETLPDEVDAVRSRLGTLLKTLFE